MPADFARLNDAGFLLVAVPEEGGGLWRSVAETTRPICEVLRTLAAADPSVALVASMHPAVLAFWLAKPDPSREAWTEQREAVCATAADGLQWGTITSEPGSGGDMLRTKSLAEPDDADGADPRRELPRDGRQALRERLGRDVVHGHDGGAGRRGGADHLRARRARPAVGRLGRDAPDRRVGRRRHGCDAEPRHAPRVVPGDADRRGTDPCRSSPRPRDR